MRPAGHAHFHLPPAIRHLPALLGVALLFAAIYAAQREFRSLRLIDIENAVANIRPHALGCALLVSVLSYTLLTMYDRLGTLYAGCRVPYRRVAFASFCAYALAHNLGFGTLSGGAVRFRLYSHWGLTPMQIAKVVAFCSLTFGLGALTLGSIVLFSEPRAIPWLGQHLPVSALYATAAVMLAIVLGYLALSSVLVRHPMLSRGFELPGPRMAVRQIALASADVGMTATILWVLLPRAPGLTWLIFLGVYIGSFTAGLAANVPGGLGVFDSAILFGLAPFIPADRVVAAILVFRFFYYVIPLFLAGTLFAANEALVRGPVRLRVAEPDLAVGAATGTVALSAVLLLGVGVLSRRTPDLAWADPDLITVATRAGQFVPSLIGAALLVLGIALAQRVRLAWAGTIVLLLLGAVFIVAEGERGWIAAILGLSALLLSPFRGYFYRRARLSFGSVDPASAVSLLALAVCMLALAGFRRQLHGMPNNAWWELILSGHIHWGLRASVAATVAVALAALWALVRPCRVAWSPVTPELRRRMDCAARVAEGAVWGDAGRAALPFRRLERVLLGVGDPIGEQGDRVSAIWRFRDLARQEDRHPAIWQAGPDLLSVYADLGLSAWPLDDNGLPLPHGGDPPATRYLLCGAERDLRALVPVLGDLARETAPG